MVFRSRSTAGGYFGACSCSACQKATGSVFSMSAYFPQSAVAAIAGAHRVYRRQSDGGRWLDFHFCPTCAATVFWYAEFDPDSVGISGGNFVDPGFGPPQYAVWCESRHPWVRFPEDCRTFPQHPGLSPFPGRSKSMMGPHSPQSAAKQ